MKIKRLIGGSLESNGYIIYDKEGGEGFVIDPGYNGVRFLQEIEKLNIEIKGILLTHHHYDHVGAVEKLRQAFSCPVCIHWGDCDMYKGRIDREVADGDQFFIGDEELKVVHTPGHTKGSICYYSEKSKIAFTGDTIFNVDLGRTDLTDGSEEEMMASVRNIISQWGNDITIYPGHGDPATMKYVRAHNREYLDLLG